MQSNSKNPTSSTNPVKSADTVEITLPENLSSYLTPIVLMFGTILIAIAIFVTGNNIATNIKNLNITAGSNAAVDNEPSEAAEVTVTDEMLASLWDKPNVIKIGNKDAKIQFVEFSDPSCPYCHIAGGYNPELALAADQTGKRFQYNTDGGSYVPPVKEMQKLVNEGKASFMFIYTNGHGNGELASQALYCANEQGKFWQAHEKLMTNDAYAFINDGAGKSSAPEMAKYLAGVVNEGDMLSCLESGRHVATLQQDSATAIEFGVSGTPGFLVNTTRFSGAYSFTDMELAVNAGLQK